MASGEGSLVATGAAADGRSVGRTVARLARQIEVVLAEMDLTLPQYRIMAVLDEGTAVVASKLADSLAVRRPTVTAVVDGLVERGLVERHHDQCDRRRVGHSLTPAGQQVLSTADAAVDARLAAIAGRLEAPGQAADARRGLDLWQMALLSWWGARRKGHS